MISRLRGAPPQWPGQANTRAQVGGGSAFGALLQGVRDTSSQNHGTVSAEIPLPGPAQTAMDAGIATESSSMTGALSIKSDEIQSDVLPGIPSIAEPESWVQDIPLPPRAPLPAMVVPMTLFEPRDEVRPAAALTDQPTGPVPTLQPAESLASSQSQRARVSDAVEHPQTSTVERHQPTAAIDPRYEGSTDVQRDTGDTDRVSSTASSALEETGLSLPSQQDVVSFDIRSERGRNTETIEIPWRLLAHAVLSHRGRSASAAGSRSVHLQSEMVENMRPSFVSVVPVDTNTAVGTSVDEPAVDRYTLPPSVLLIARQRATPHTIELEAGFSQTSVAVPWAMRLVRWSSDQASETAVWLRDFTMDDETASALLSTLQEFGRSQGIHVTRMMFNGRELWRAPSLNH